MAIAAGGMHPTGIIIIAQRILMYINLKYFFFYKTKLANFPYWALLNFNDAFLPAATKLWPR